MGVKKSSRIAMGVMFFLFLVGCAPVVREATKVDTSLPVGKMEGNQYVGVRSPGSAE